MGRSLVRILVLLVAAIQVVAGAPRPDGVLLCFGGDCHPEAVVPTAGPCDDGCPRHGDEDEGVSIIPADGAPRHCSCTDVRVPREGWRGIDPRETTAFAAASLPAAVLPPPAIAVRPTGPRPDATGPPPPHLGALRTIRLQV